MHYPLHSPSFCGSSVTLSPRTGPAELSWKQVFWLGGKPHPPLFLQHPDLSCELRDELCAEGSVDDAGGSVLFSTVILVPINLEFVILE